MFSCYFNTLWEYQFCHQLRNSKRVCCLKISNTSVNLFLFQKSICIAAFSMLLYIYFKKNLYKSPRHLVISIFTSRGLSMLSRKQIFEKLCSAFSGSTKRLLVLDSSRNNLPEVSLTFSMFVSLLFFKSRLYFQHVLFQHILAFLDHNIGKCTEGC